MKSTVNDLDREIYDRASFDNTRLEQKNESKSGCIRFCYRRSIVNEV